MINNIPPFFNKHSKILILGSFPSVISRQNEFFYANKQNRFWKVLSFVFDEKEPASLDDKKSLLCNHNIALWDIVKSCDIKGSSDSTITNLKTNDINQILKNSDISHIFTNGSKASSLYKKYILKDTFIQNYPLASTSPANARYSLEKLISEWSILSRI